MTRRGAFISRFLEKVPNTVKLKTISREYFNDTFIERAVQFFALFNIFTFQIVDIEFRISPESVTTHVTRLRLRMRKNLSLGYK